jgi:hypothetical protein
MDAIILFKEFLFLFQKVYTKCHPSNSNQSLLLKDGHGSHVKNDRLSKRLWIKHNYFIFTYITSPPTTYRKIKMKPWIEMYYLRVD